MSVAACPHCGQPLNDVVTHCKQPIRCGWVWHKPCGTVIDLRRPKRFIPLQEGTTP